MLLTMDCHSLPLGKAGLLLTFAISNEGEGDVLNGSSVFVSTVVDVMGLAGQS